MLKFRDLDEVGEVFPKFRINLQKDMKKHVASLGEGIALTKQLLSSTNAINMRTELNKKQENSAQAATNVGDLEDSIFKRADRVSSKKPLSEIHSLRRESFNGGDDDQQQRKCIAIVGGMEYVSGDVEDFI